MTDRTFQQFAQGYGSTPCQVVCQIDGNTVFCGSVTTLDQPMPGLPDPEFNVTNVGWTWQGNAAFSGTQSISVAVNGSPLLFGGTLANNPYGNADIFLSFYSVTVDGVDYADPFTNETIDGVPQPGPYDANLGGQWWWVIPAGSTFAATMHVTGIEPPNSP